jgi:hypothetical protein
MTRNGKGRDSCIIKLADARALQQMKAPLTTPVEEREFSPSYQKQWGGLMSAHGAFLVAIDVYVRVASLGRWRKLKRRLMALDRVATRCVEFAASQPDEPERALMALFLKTRASPFIQYWAGAIDAVDDGAELTIRPGDVPVWYDEVHAT